VKAAVFTPAQVGQILGSRTSQSDASAAGQITVKPRQAHGEMPAVMR
jgi:hypothetical protein